VFGFGARGDDGEPGAVLRPFVPTGRNSVEMAQKMDLEAKTFHRMAQMLNRMPQMLHWLV